MAATQFGDPMTAEELARTPATTPSPSVYLVRHAETEWSRNGRHTGSTDLPITEAGRRSLTPLRERLDAIEFEHVLASPLLRARQTSEELGYGRRMQLRAELAEWRYGKYEGLTPDQIQQCAPGWDLWTQGAPGGETPEDVSARIDRIVRILDAPPDQATESTLVIAHGHCLRALAARWLGLPIATGKHLRLNTGTVSLLGWHRGLRVLQHWNAAST